MTYDTHIKKVSNNYPKFEKWDDWWNIKDNI